MDVFELDQEDLAFVLGEDPPAEVIEAAKRRARDPLLLKRGAAASKAFQPVYEAALAEFCRAHTDLCEGLFGSGQTHFRPKPTKGGSAVLVRLIQVILSPASAHRTQQECRQVVEAEFPNHAVFKTWTKPLPSWALARAKAMVAGSPAPISALKLKMGVTLKELHSAVRAAVDGATTQASVKVEITDEAVFVNGHRFSRTVNRSGGKEYPFVRLPIRSLEAALRAKSKAS